MLAATPPKERQPLDLFVFALSLIGHGSDVPQALREYLRSILHQAKELAIDPARVHQPVMPEAIELALQMKKGKNFSTEVLGVKDESAVTPEDAKKLLTAVEKAFVYQD